MRNAFFAVIAVVCGLLTLLLVLTSVMVLSEALSVRESPLRTDMAGAVNLAKSGKSTWVQLTDAAADCKRYSAFTSRWDDGTRQSGAFIARNPANDIEFAVVVHDIRACEYLGAVHYIGMLKKLDAEERRKFAADGLLLSETHGPQYWLCTYCVPERDWGVIITLLVLAAVTGLMAFKVWRARQLPEAPVPAPANKPIGAQRGRANKKRRPR